MKRKFSRSKRAIVGIEAAIVMIAFVVIAAAFAFMVVNMGLFSTQRSQEAIQQGLKEASCPLTIDGSILLKSDVQNENNVSTIIIPLKTIGVKYVPMWTNETVVSIKIGTRTALANIYAGIDHDIDPSAMTFETIINGLGNVNVTETSIELSNETSTSLSRAPIVNGSLTLTNSSKTLTDAGNGSLICDNKIVGSITYINGVVMLTNASYEATYTAVYQVVTRAVLVVDNDNGDDSLDFFEKGFLIVQLGVGHRAQPRDNILIEIRPEKSAPLTVSFTVPEAIPADAYVTLE